MHFLLCKSIALYFLKKATRDSFRDSFFAAQTKRIVVHICLFYWGISIQINTKYIANTYIIHPKLYYNSIFSSSLQCLMAVILCLVSNNKNKKKTFLKMNLFTTQFSLSNIVVICHHYFRVHRISLFLTVTPAQTFNNCRCCCYSKATPDGQT